MKLLRVSPCFQQSTGTHRSVDAASAMTSMNGSRENNMNHGGPSLVEEKHEDPMLGLEIREEAGSFFSRLLSREVAVGYSSRIYYRAPSLGRIPFNWEAEPGKPKIVGSCDMKEELVDHEIIPPLSPPPFLQAKNNDNSYGFSSRKRRAGLMHEIVYFLQRKTQMKAKLVRMAGSQTAEMALSDTDKARDEMKIKTGGIGIKNRITSDSHCEVDYAATETEDDDGDLMSDFSHMSFQRSDTSSSSSSSNFGSSFLVA